MTDLQQLAGRRILLRTLRLEDATDRYVGWLNDPRVNRFLESRFTRWTLQSVRDYISTKQNPQEHFFAICDIANANHVGNIKLGPIDPHHKCADVSLFIGDTAYWSRGAGSEAIALVTGLAFDQLSLLKLQAGAYLANIGCIKAFERCGFSREGLLKERVLSNGVPDDVVILGYAESDYRKRRSP